MTSKRLSSMRGLDARNLLKLTLAHLYALLTKADLARCAFDKWHTVRVQDLVGRAHPGLSLACPHPPSGHLRLVAPVDVFEHGSLHRRLDQLEQQEPDDVPHQMIPIQPPGTPWILVKHSQRTQRWSTR